MANGHWGVAHTRKTIRPGGKILVVPLGIPTGNGGNVAEKAEKERAARFAEIERKNLAEGMLIAVGAGRNAKPPIVDNIREITAAGFLELRRTKQLVSPFGAIPYDGKTANKDMVRLLRPKMRVTIDADAEELVVDATKPNGMVILRRLNGRTLINPVPARRLRIVAQGA